MCYIYIFTQFFELTVLLLLVEKIHSGKIYLYNMLYTERQSAHKKCVTTAAALSLYMYNYYCKIYMYLSVKTIKHTYAAKLYSRLQLIKPAT